MDPKKDEVPNTEEQQVHEEPTQPRSDEKTPEQQEPDWKAEAARWKRTSDGAQGVINSQKQQMADLKAQLEAMKSTHQNDLAAQASEFSALQQELQALKGKYEEETSSLPTLREERERLGHQVETQKLLMTAPYRDVPELLEAYIKGHLKDGLTGDELTSYLDDWVNILGSAASRRSDKDFSGTVPPRPSPVTEKSTRQELYKRLMSMDPNSEEYIKLERQYDALIEQETRP
jgi:hypothetical protein